MQQVLRFILEQVCRDIDIGYGLEEVTIVRVHVYLKSCFDQCKAYLLHVLIVQAEITPPVFP